MPTFGVVVLLTCSCAANSGDGDSSDTEHHDQGEDNQSEDTGSTRDSSATETGEAGETSAAAEGHEPDAGTGAGNGTSSNPVAPAATSAGSTTSSLGTFDTTSTRGDAGSDEPAVAPVLGDGVEFIPWADFQKSEVGDTGGGLRELNAPLRLSSVASGGGYAAEDLLIAIRTEADDNLVVALDTQAKTFREHWPHFPCGDCLVAASGLGSVILTSSTLYGSTDGGYRYFTIGEGGFGESAERVVRAVDDRVWVRSEAGWLGAALSSNEVLEVPAWSQLSIASVDRSSGLEVTAQHITRYSAEETTTTTDVCSTIPSVEFGVAFHSQDVVVVRCDERSVRVTSDFPAQTWQTLTLDAPVVWVGGTFVASEASWYAVPQETLGMRVGSQSMLREGEIVLGYAETATRAYRITNLGVAITVGAPSDSGTP